ncbi:hypothetical protein FNJ88_07920 [Chryseobacterium sp. SNU WT5]|uniref:DUF6146 family protein n=1 Tax=Chryseobacterium sp. SNU WT5 TaxID=2594269 RepID=UPI00117FD15C|nr:DUF6146 family protein [Chryseobacterium sp. SNU WT5]QDP85490.1 hypothetical protein FNJ88_07920 [Chryseobacterium sp. SNU WT5]
MNKIIFSILVLFIIFGCTPQNTITDNKENIGIKPQFNDDGEYDLVVFDSQYDYFLSAVARPMNTYTEDYLKSKNRFLVTEWNSLYYSGRNRNIIESSIDYDPTINYGIKYEYKLYQVFAYVRWKYGLRLNGLSAGDIR